MADIQNLWGDLIKPEDVRSIGASLGKQAERGDEPSFSASFGAGLDVAQAGLQRTGQRVAEALGARDTAESLSIAAEENILQAEPNLYQGTGTAADLVDPMFWRQGFANMLGGSVPFLATVGVGGAAGAYLAAGRLIGSTIGGSVGGGLGSFVQSYGDNYYSYIDNNPGDFEGADDYAVKASGLGAALDAASVAIAPIGPAINGIKSALQRTAIQTLLQGAAEGGNQYAQNLLQRRYIDSGIDPMTGVATAAVGGGLLEAAVLPAELAAARRIGGGPLPAAPETPAGVAGGQMDTGTIPGGVAPPPAQPTAPPPEFATQRLTELEAVQEPSLEQAIERSFLRENLADPAKFDLITQAYDIREEGPVFRRAEEIQPAAIAKSVGDAVKVTQTGRDVIGALTNDVKKLMAGEYRDSTVVNIADVYRPRITAEEGMQMQAERSVLRDRLDSLNQRITDRKMQLDRTAPSQTKQVKTLRNLIRSEESQFGDLTARLAAIEYLFPQFETTATPQTAGVISRFPQSAISAGIEPVQQPFFGQAPQTTLERIMSRYDRGPAPQRESFSGQIIPPPTRDVAGVEPPVTELARPSLGAGAGSPVTRPASNRIEAVARSATNIIPQTPAPVQPIGRLEGFIRSATPPEPSMRRMEPAMEPAIVEQTPPAAPEIPAIPEAQPAVATEAQVATEAPPAAAPAAQPAARQRRGRRPGALPNAQARGQLSRMVETMPEGAERDALQTAINALAAQDLRTLERGRREPSARTTSRQQQATQAAPPAQPRVEAEAAPTPPPAEPLRSILEDTPPAFGRAVGETATLLRSPTASLVNYGTANLGRAGQNLLSPVPDDGGRAEVTAAFADLVDNFGLPRSLIEGIEVYQNTSEADTRGMFFRDDNAMSLAGEFFNPANFETPGFREALRFVIAHELGHNLHNRLGYETPRETRISYQTLTINDGGVTAVSGAAPPMIREIFGLLANEMRTVIVPNATRMTEEGMAPDDAIAKATREAGVATQFAYPFFYIGDRRFNGPYGKDWAAIQSEIISQIFAIHTVNPQWLEQNAPLASAFINREIARNESVAGRQEVPSRVRAEVRTPSPGLGLAEPPVRGGVRGEEVAGQERAEPGVGGEGEVRRVREGQRNTVLGGVRDVAPTFYSAVKSAVDTLKMAKAPGQQWLSTLRNIPGVKPEEIEYYDLPEWLSSQTGPVTKEQLLDQINQRQIDVVDAVGGDKYSSYTFPGGSNYRELLLTLPPRKGMTNFVNEMHDFSGVENILAHVRVKDRSDLDGNRVLHIEEVQSDWHQAGRERGYGEESGIPDAPFKTSWPDLALKRMVRFAAENGYDRIAWTTGADQKFRYDIRRNFSEVLYKKNPNGTFHVRPLDKSGEIVGEQRSVKQGDLSKSIPKVVAERMLNGEGTQSQGRNRGFTSMTGDLLDSGDGLIEFYDKQLVKRAEKLFSKLGGKVSIGELEVKPEGSDDYNYSSPSKKYARQALADGAEVDVYLDDEGSFNFIGTAKDSDELNSLTAEYGDYAEFEFQVSFPEAMETKRDFIFLDIPNSLKDAAVYKGFPLFMNQRNSAIASAVNSGAFGSIGHAVDSMQTIINSSLEQARPTSIYNGADETLRDTLTRRFVNSFYRLERFQKEMAKSIGLERISDEMDAAGQIERFSGQVTEDERQIQRKYLEPMMKYVFDKKLDYNMVNLFAYARHAPERNADIARKNAARYDELRQKLLDKYDGDLSRATLAESKDLERYLTMKERFADRGSGMSDKDAAEIMNRFRDEGKYDQYNAAMSYVDDLVKSTQQKMVAAGLIEEEVVGTWNDKFSSYVPLSGWAIDEFDSPQNSPMRVGRGFSIGGKESLAALGRQTMAFPPVTNAIKQAYEKTIRARKVEVGRRFLNLVRTFKDDTLWEIIDKDNPIFNRYMDAKKDAVLLRRQTTRGPGEDFFEVKENGQTVLIDIKDDKLRRAMLNLGAADMGDVVNGIQNTFGRVTSFLSGMTTRWNPAWSVINVPRDFMAGMINLVAEADLQDGLIKGAGKVNGKTVTQAAISDYVSLKYHKALSRYLENKAGNTAEDNFVKEFFEDGGATGYVRNLDARELHRDLQSSIDLLGESAGIEGVAATTRIKRGLNGVKNAIEHFNDMTENAVRVVAYVNARKAGVTRDRSALLAKNVTVNFNRRGEAGPLMNSLYMFWQASINGNLQFFRTMSSAEARKVMYYAAGAAAAVTMFSIASSDEEENGKTEWENLPDYVKETGLPIKIPGMPMLVIPLPYGYSILTYAAIKATETLSGIESAGGFASKVLGKIVNDVMPLRLPGGDKAGLDLEATGVVKAITPTAVRPLVDLAINTDFAGNPIYKENPEFAKVKMPDSALHRRGTTDAAIAFTNLMNKATGGTSYQPGLIDINPDSVEYLIGEVFGGAGRTLMQAYGVAEKTATGKDIEIRQIPILNKVVKTTTWTMNPGDFYDRIDSVYRTEAEAKTLRGSERGDFLDENKVDYRALPLAKSAQSRLRKLYEQRKNIQNSTLSESDKEERIERVELEIQKVYDTFNSGYQRILDREG